MSTHLEERSEEDGSNKETESDNEFESEDEIDMDYYLEEIIDKYDTLPQPTARVLKRDSPKN